jgi:NAD(P)H dehydrogenase (quinone)
MYAHPNPKSFNAGILDTVKKELDAAKIQYTVSDLYAMKFNPVLSGADFGELTQGRVPPDIAEEQKMITDAKTLFFIYPVWWMSPPAMLKGYIDRVFAMNFAYRYTEVGAEGLLEGKDAVLISTYGNFAEKYEQSKLGSSIAEILHDGILGFCGIRIRDHLNLYGVPFVDDAARKGMLEQVRKSVQKAIPAGATAR